MNNKEPIKSNKPLAQIKQGIVKELPISERELEEAAEWIDAQLLEVNKDTKGILVATYGNSDYVVSGRAGKRLAEHMRPKLKEKYPHIMLLVLPFYMKVEWLEIDRFLQEGINSENTKS